jgi:hypothetical protein
MAHVTDVAIVDLVTLDVQELELVVCIGEVRELIAWVVG